MPSKTKCRAPQLAPRFRLSGLIFVLSAIPAFAQERELLTLINEYRSAPHTCEGKTYSPAGPLAPNAALSRVRAESSVSLEEALKEVEYQAAHVQTITVSGPANPRGVMAFIRKSYCGALMNPRYSEIGVSRDVNTWRILLAQPLLSPDLGNWQQAGSQVLELTNDARSKPRSCGRKNFTPAPPLDWNSKLASAALAHSRDMARQNYFGHVAPNGGKVEDRAGREAYNWRRVGENIATGQGSPAQVVSGWLASPSHCANIMNPDFVDMGAAYAINPESKCTIYWTQVFGTPKKQR